ncbi:hypothetical protein STEG23_022463 [Scotinomys teguina]
MTVSSIGTREIEMISDTPGRMVDVNSVLLLFGDSMCVEVNGPMHLWICHAYTLDRMMLETQGDRANEMAQLVKVLAAKPDDLSLIQSANMIEGNADFLRLSL